MEMIGLIPAAGKASRLGLLPFSKELLPVGFKKTETGLQTITVVSHHLLSQYRRARCFKTYMILRNGKWDIPAYFGNGRSVGMDLAYLMTDVFHGVPYTLDQAYPFVRHAKVLLGFPDVLFQAGDAFVQIDETLEKTGADMVLGIFQPRDSKQMRKTDMVEWDKEGGIRRIIVKPTASHLPHCWILAMWKPVFSDFMHDFLKQDKIKRAQSPIMEEIHMGDIVQKGIDAGLKVRGHLFSQCGYLDVGTADDLHQAFKEYLIPSFES